jgi:hypothetical protein
MACGPKDVARAGSEIVREGATKRISAGDNHGELAIGGRSEIEGNRLFLAHFQLHFLFRLNLHLEFLDGKSKVLVDLNLFTKTLEADRQRISGR